MSKNNYSGLNPRGYFRGGTHNKNGTDGNQTMIRGGIPNIKRIVRPNNLKQIDPPPLLTLNPKAMGFESAGTTLREPTYKTTVKRKKLIPPLGYVYPIPTTVIIPPIPIPPTPSILVVFNNNYNLCGTDQQINDMVYYI